MVLKRVFAMVAVFAILAVGSVVTINYFISQNAIAENEETIEPPYTESDPDAIPEFTAVDNQDQAGMNSLQLDVYTYDPVLGDVVMTPTGGDRIAWIANEGTSHAYTSSIVGHFGMHGGSNFGCIPIDCESPAEQPHVTGFTVQYSSTEDGSSGWLPLSDPSIAQVLYDIPSGIVTILPINDSGSASGATGATLYGKYITVAYSLELTGYNPWVWTTIPTLITASAECANDDYGEWPDCVKNEDFEIELGEDGSLTAGWEIDDIEEPTVSVHICNNLGGQCIDINTTETADSTITDGIIAGTWSGLLWVNDGQDEALELSHVASRTLTAVASASQAISDGGGVIDERLESIQWMLQYGIDSGCDGSGASLKYCPNDPVTRGAMALLLNRVAGLPVVLAESSQFVDVQIDDGTGNASFEVQYDDGSTVLVSNTSSEKAGAIDFVTSRGVMGVPNGLDGQPASFSGEPVFLPWQPLRLVDMAVIFANYVGVELVPTDEPHFQDVSGLSEYEVSAIHWVWEKGITGGCNEAGTQFCPNMVLSRGALAQYMHRLAYQLGATRDVPGSLFGPVYDQLAPSLPEVPASGGTDTGWNEPSDSGGAAICGVGTGKVCPVIDVTPDPEPEPEPEPEPAPEPSPEPPADDDTGFDFWAGVYNFFMSGANGFLFAGFSFFFLLLAFIIAWRFFLLAARDDDDDEEQKAQIKR